MNVRTKIWLIAVSVAVTVFVSSWARLYLTQARIIKEAQTSAEELAHDIAEDLKSIEAEADDREFEEKLLGYLNRHSRIVRLDLYIYREAYTPSSRIAAPRGDRPEITRFAPLSRPPLGFTKASVGGAQAAPIELPVDLNGRWRCWRAPCGTSRRETCRGASPSTPSTSSGGCHRGSTACWNDCPAPTR